MESSRFFRLSGKLRDGHQDGRLIIWEQVYFNSLCPRVRTRTPSEEVLLSKVDR